MQIGSPTSEQSAIFLRVIGLEVEESFTLGKARFLTYEDGLARLAEVCGTPFASPSFVGPGGEFIKRDATLVELTTDPIPAELSLDPLIFADSAISSARRTLDVLRVLYCRGVSDKYFPIFGLAGELVSGAVDYLVPLNGVNSGARFGSRRAGHIRGAVLSKSVLDRWRDWRVFQFLDESLRNPDASDGARRALLGSSLLSTSILERNPDVALILATSALEAFVMPEGRGGKTLKLARHLAWLGCLVNDERNQCGRHRDACPYLLLDPDDDKQRKDLEEIKVIAQSDSKWRCSEWMRVVEWYDIRSETVHGRSLGHSEGIADEAQYWITTRLFQPIILWLADHPYDPTGELENALNTLSQPTNWTEFAAQIRNRDFNSPPKYDSRRWEERDDTI